MTKDEALKLALDALERSVATCFDKYAHYQVMSKPDHFINQTITAIREALAQPEQEPVATVAEVHMSRYTIEWTNGSLPEGTKLYTTPPQPKQEQEPVEWDGKCVLGHCGSPAGCEDSDCCRADFTTPSQREWVGLTDEEKHQLNNALNLQGRFPIIDAIEAKLREKNNG